MGKLSNEEFLNKDSIEVEMSVHFVFGGHEMVMELLDPSDGTFNIYKKANMLNHLFQTAFNEQKKRPRITWEKDIPLDIDILVAADVMVAKMYQMLKEQGVDIPFGRKV